MISGKEKKEKLNEILKSIIFHANIPSNKETKAHKSDDKLAKNLTQCTILKFFQASYV